MSCGVSAQLRRFPMMNILNRRLSMPDNADRFQEFMVVPDGGESCPRRPLAGAEIFPHAEEAASRKPGSHRGRRRKAARSDPPARPATRSISS
jgi:enolase